MGVFLLGGPSTMLGFPFVSVNPPPTQAVNRSGWCVFAESYRVDRPSNKGWCGGKAGAPSRLKGNPLPRATQGFGPLCSGFPIGIMEHRAGQASVFLPVLSRK